MREVDSERVPFITLAEQNATQMYQLLLKNLNFLLYIAIHTTL